MKEFIVRVIDPEEIRWFEEEPETPELVRCKDCCMGEPYPHEAGKTWCHLMSETHKDDWFCADGVRKEGDGE